jgi:hypothetical protein
MFRAWDRKSKKMYIFDEVSICNEYNLLGFHWEGNHDYADLDIDEEDIEIMQFTGLYDIGKKPIYEGDVIDRMPLYKGQTTVQRVIWKEYRWEGIDGYNISKVIGNRFENPELLERLK